MIALKTCADFLRAYSSSAGVALRAGHAHELAAAFFGYPTAAACRAEQKYLLANLQYADVLFPDVSMMDQRRERLDELSDNLAGSNELANSLAQYLNDHKLYTRSVFIANNLNDAIIEYADAELAYSILNGEGASGAIAETNASFNDMETGSADSYNENGTLYATIDGALYGDHDFASDRVFRGDKIAFSSELEFEQTAGRVAFLSPSVETTGSVDDSDYFNDDLDEDE